MAEPFDPYHRWLGIPPHEQPPDHYRLLGIGRFESNPDVIESAADRQMAHLRTYQSGPHGALSQKLLNEVSAAKLCLLDPKRRAAYDVRLREAILARQDGAASPALAEPAASDEPALAGMIEEVEAKPGVSRPTGRRQDLPLGPLLAGAAMVVVTLIVGAVWLTRSGKDASGPVAHGDSTKPSPSKVTPTDGGNRPSAGGKTPGKGGKDKTDPKPDDPRAKPSDPAKQGKTDKKWKFLPAEGDPESKSAADPGDDPPPKPGEGWQPGALPGTAERPGADPGAAPEKLPVPDEAAQAKATKLAEEVYKDDLAGAKSAAQKQALAKKILGAAAATRDDPAARFVLYRMARETAAEAGDGQTAFEAADAAADAFDADPLPMKAEVLARFNRMARNPDQYRSVAEQAQSLAEEAAGRSNFDVAGQLAEIALSNARKLRNSAAVKPIAALSKRIKEMAAARTAVEKAQQALQEKPDDPAANLAVGRYYCFLAGDWEQGLPHLAKGSDEALKALAEQETAAPPAAAEEQVKLADAWWDLAQARTEEKDAISLHAGAWYERARPNLPDGLLKAKVEKQLEKIATIDRPAGGAGPKTIRPGQWVDALKHVDPARDGPKGEWAKSAAGLAVTPQSFSRLVIPVRVEGSYELQVEFTRESGSGPVVVVLPVGGSAALVAFSADNGRFHGMEMIDGATVRDSPVRVRRGILVNGQRHAAAIRVRLQGENAEVAVLLDNQPCLRWIGKQTSLSLNATWQAPQDTGFGLGAGSSNVTFQRVAFRLSSGKAAVAGAKPAPAGPSP